MTNDAWHCMRSGRCLMFHCSSYKRQQPSSHLQAPHPHSGVHSSQQTGTQLTANQPSSVCSSHQIGTQLMANQPSSVRSLHQIGTQLTAHSIPRSTCMPRSTRIRFVQHSKNCKARASFSSHSPASVRKYWRLPGSLPWPQILPTEDTNRDVA